jgi:glycyl-tRNA synthetase
MVRVAICPTPSISNCLPITGGKKHSRFYEVADMQLNLLDRNVQLSGKADITQLSIGQAVEKGIVNNESLGYFLAKTQLFLVELGCNPEKIRFRQHGLSELAHYSVDCWDAVNSKTSACTQCLKN